MSLSTIMGHAGLAGYAIAAMVIFMAVFASILLRLWFQSRRGGLEEAGRLPLEEDVPAGTASGNREERT